MTDKVKDILDNIRAKKQIKNDPASYKRLGGDWQWSQTTTVMHKKTSAPRVDEDIDSYTFHADPEINRATIKHVKANYGRTSWQVSGEIYAELLYKFRRLEEATGILVNEPKKEELEKSTILKEAYKKYKFVEKMVLGK